MNTKTKKILQHALAVVIFLLLSAVYFYPAVFQGKTMRQGDVIQYLGGSQEAREYSKTEESKEHAVIGWTGSMFSGMPTYVITTQKAPTNFLSYIEKPIKAFSFDGVGIILAALICFYILMNVLGANFWLSLAGAIAFAFSSYNIIIIGAGHITKAYVIAYMPLTIAGMFLVFRQKWLWGFLLTLIGLTLSFRNNHIQISYYLAFFCVFIYLFFLFREIKEKSFRLIGKTTGVFVIALFIAILPSLNVFYGNYEMSKESIRGKSELTAANKDGEKELKGLDLDYAFSWSYGKAETLTFLIPDFYGGSSGGELGVDSELYKAMKKNRIQTGKKVQTATYWGDQPFTSGPVYLGAIVCFLFVLGMFVIKNPLKWWIFAATLFFIFLSWGKNFMFFNEFLFHYLPFYNKFRTPSMALVIPGLSFPLIAIWGLKEIFSEKTAKAEVQKALLYSFGAVGGLCLLFWLFPGLFFDFQSVKDPELGLPSWYYNALLKDRASLLASDAFRSFVFVLMAALVIFFFLRTKKRKNVATYASAVICLLIFVDLCGVDLRYLNYESFVTKKTVSAFPKTTADKAILQDKEPSYRVLNLNNPFNDAGTSYYHKSIGGYSGAKIGRYQDLIEHHVNNEIKRIISSLQKIRTQEDFLNLDLFSETPILNMLNTRYLIFNPSQNPIFNSHAAGNAWFAKEVRLVNNADEEIKILGEIDPETTLLVDKRFAEAVDKFQPKTDETASIKLLSYEPVKLVYQTRAQTEQLAVFSEVYYPHGWQAYIDGEPVEHFRANWILRAMLVSAGEHILEFRFVPKTYILSARIASGASFLVLLLLLAALVRQFYIAFFLQRKE